MAEPPAPQPAPDHRPSFSLIDWLIATAVIGILAGIAFAFTSGRPAHRRSPILEATTSLPALKSFEEFWREKSGAYVYSEALDDRVTFAVASWNRCEERATGRPFQDATAGAWTPDGCEWDYVVVEGRCGDTCDPVADLEACPEPGSCFCAIALSPRLRVRRKVGDARLCIDDTGRQRFHDPDRPTGPIGRASLGWGESDTTTGSSTAPDPG